MADRLTTLPLDIFKIIVTKLNAPEATRLKILNKTAKMAVEDPSFREVYNKKLFDKSAWLFVHKFDDDFPQTGVLLGFRDEDLARISVSLHPLLFPYLNPGDRLTLLCAARSYFVFSRVGLNPVSLLVVNICGGTVSEVNCPVPISELSLNRIRESSKVIVDADGVDYSIIHVTTLSYRKVIYCEYRSATSQWEVVQAVFSANLDLHNPRGMIMMRDLCDRFLVSFMGEEGPTYFIRNLVACVGPAIHEFHNELGVLDLHPPDDLHVGWTRGYSVGTDGFFVDVLLHVLPADGFTRIWKIGLAEFNAHLVEFHHVYTFGDHWLQTVPFVLEGQGFHVAKHNDMVYCATSTRVGAQTWALVLYQVNIQFNHPLVRTLPPFPGQQVGRIV